MEGESSNKIAKLKTEWRYLIAQPTSEQKLASTNSLIKSRLGVKRAPRLKISESGKAWIALIPSLIFLLAFMIYPIINTFLMSFIINFRFMKGSGGSFAISNYIVALQAGRNVSWGFQNYFDVLSNSEFQNALANTAIIVVVSVPLTIIIGLLIAVFLNSIKPLQGFFQTVFFLPYVTNAIALGMVFKIIFTDGSGGMFNNFLSWFGISPQSWLSVSADKWHMLFVIILYSIWNGIAFKILVFQSGLSSIDRQYYDAAKVDGANRRTIFRRITMPMLSPQILYITITSFIGAFKAYTSIISLFGAGAYNFGGTTGKNWETVVGYIYVIMQNQQLQGRAAAASLVLLLIILAITLIQMAVSKKKVVF